MGNTQTKATQSDHQVEDNTNKKKINNDDENDTKQTQIIDDNVNNVVVNNVVEHKNDDNEHYKSSLDINCLTEWKKGVGICIISDFEYDDIVLIGSLLMNAMFKLSDDDTPHLHDIINNLQIIYFADSLKKDAKNIWKKKLKMAEYFFPKLVYDKIVIRWRNGIKNAPKDFFKQNLNQYNVSCFVSNMKDKVDIFIIAPGHNALQKLSDQMKNEGKNVNRFIMSVGSFNGNERESSESDMDTLFKWSQESINKIFVDSSRFPWSGPKASGSIHELGNKQKMIEMLKTTDNGYKIVMDYLKQFNSALILNQYYSSNDNEEILQLTKQLKNEFNLIQYNKLCKIIVEDAYKYKYYKYDNIDKLNLEKLNDFDDPKNDWTNLNNWKLDDFNKRNDFMRGFKFKIVLSNIANLDEDGPAADPVISYWHWFPNQHKLVYGQMLKHYDGMEQDIKSKYKKLKQIFPKFFSLRTMIIDSDYQKIIKNISECVSRGNMLQVQLINKPQSNEELAIIAKKWRFIYQKFLDFRNVT